MEETRDENIKMDEQVLKKIQEEVRKIQYGSVTIVVHGGKVVQLDTNTKIRLV